MSKKDDFLRDMILRGLIGSASSGFTELVLFPLENIKIRLQLTEKEETSESKSFYQEMVSTMADVVAREGISGLYSGLVPYLIFNMVKWGAFFPIRDCVRKILEKAKLIKNDFLRDIVINYVSGSLNTFLICPLSVIFSFVVSYRKRTGRSLSMIQAALKIFQKKGFSGFYSGLGMSLILIISPTLNLTLFSFFKKLKSLNGVTSVNDFTIGAFTKMISTLVTFPLSTIKVNQQGKNSRKGILMMVMTIIMRSGLGGFYKGLSSKLVKSAFQNGMMLYFNEKIKKRMGVKGSQDRNMKRKKRE